jgi:hypothetical protein
MYQAEYILIQNAFIQPAIFSMLSLRTPALHPFGSAGSMIGQISGITAIHMQYRSNFDPIS